MPTTKRKVRRAAKPARPTDVHVEAIGNKTIAHARLHSRAKSVSRGDMWITKAASTVGGGVSAGLAAAILAPSAPALAGIATLAGLIGSGIWIAKHG
jgi:hypothetical protein